MCFLTLVVLKFSIPQICLEIRTSDDVSDNHRPTPNSGELGFKVQ